MSTTSHASVVARLHRSPTPGRDDASASHATGARAPWIDAARGALIVLVAFYHVTEDLAVVGSPGQAIVDLVCGALRPVRMPLFFVLSGMLAAGALDRSWRDMLRRKSWVFLYLYLVWSVIQGAVTAWTRGDVPTPVELAGQIAVAPSYLWYLYALALYFPLAKFLRPFTGRTLVVSLSVYLLSVQGWDNPGLKQLPAVAAYFLWFFAGVTWSVRIKTEAAHPGRWTMVLAAAVLVGTQAVELLVVGERIPVLTGAESAAAVVLGTGFFAWAVSRLHRTTSLLGWVGRHTLPIYVIHIPILQIVAYLVHGTAFRPATAVGVLVLMIASTAAILAASLTLAALIHARTPHLLALPARSPRR